MHLSPSESAAAVAVAIEAELARTGLKPGWRLPSEERLAAMHGVSRGVVRAALAGLRERGVLTSRRGGGTFVNSGDASAVAQALRGYAGVTQTDKAFGELLELRMLIEAECARALAAQHRKEALNRMDDAYAAMRRCRDEPIAFAKADFEFHRALVRESGNALFHAIMEALGGVFDDYSRHSHTAIGGRRDRTLAEHEAILEAIRAGDGDAAAHLAAAHIRRAKSTLDATRTRAVS